MVGVSKQQLSHLTREATRLGATGSTIISSKEIQVKDNLAALCNGEYACPNYGLAASCPPYVEGTEPIFLYRENRIADIPDVFR